MFLLLILVVLVLLAVLDRLFFQVLFVPDEVVYVEEVIYEEDPY